MTKDEQKEEGFNQYVKDREKLEKLKTKYQNPTENDRIAFLDELIGIINRQLSYFRTDTAYDMTFYFVDRIKMTIHKEIYNSETKKGIE